MRKTKKTTFELYLSFIPFKYYNNNNKMDFYLEHQPNMKLVSVYSLNGVIFLILFIMSTFLICRVYKLFKFNDIPVLLSIVFITLSLATLVLFNSISIMM